MGETFSCTLCANYEIQPDAGALSASSTLQAQGAELPPAQKKKWIRDVRIEAEMKTPGSGITQKLVLGPTSMPTQSEGDEDESKSGADLEPGRTLQRIVNFDLKEEGNHVLAVTVSYYEATETSGRTRTFRKLYQFICKGSLIVRTKVGVLPSASSRRKQNENRESHIEPPSEKTLREETSRKWVLEAQLENCSEDVMQLDHVKLNLEAGSRLRYRDANWTISGSAKPVLHPGEVEQVCFVVEELGREGAETDEDDTKVVFGVLGIGWRTEMGNRGFLSTGKLGTKTNTTTSR